jgi:ribonuclease VapC
MKKKESYIFDSFSLLKLLQQETGYEKVVSILEYIKSHKLTKYLQALNLGEIIYKTKREFDDQRKLEVLACIERLEFTILPTPNELVYQAAEYKAEYAISYADCFLLSSALEYDATIVTGDPDFKKVESLVKILWV